MSSNKGLIYVNNLKERLLKIKNRVESLYSEMDNVYNNLGEDIRKWKTLDSEVKQIIDNSGKSVVRFNISGKKFATTIETLLSVKDSLFFKMVVSEKINLENEIFLDRSPEYFSIILEYIRNKKFKLFRYEKYDLDNILKEAKFFEINDIIEKIISNTGIDIIRMKHSDLLNKNKKQIHINDLKELNSKGILLKPNGNVIFELNKEVELEQIEIGGYHEDNKVLSSMNPDIFAGLDVNNLRYAGSIPNSIINTNVIIDLIKTKSKYLKITCIDSFGIGYIKIIK